MIEESVSIFLSAPPSRLMALPDIKHITTYFCCRLLHSQYCGSIKTYRATIATIVFYALYCRMILNKNNSFYSFVAAPDREMISAAIRQWEELTCLTFEELPMTTQFYGQFILFTNEMGSGCVHQFGANVQASKLSSHPSGTGTGIGARPRIDVAQHPPQRCCSPVSHWVTLSCIRPIWINPVFAFVGAYNNNNNNNIYCLQNEEYKGKIYT